MGFSPRQRDGCCPASSCWEAMIQSSSVTAVPATAPAMLHNRSPLGLSLYAADDAPPPTQTSPPSPSGAYLLDGLLREINLRKAMFNERLIPWIKWQIPHHLLDSTDVTQLMYCIGRQFKLSDSRNSFYCVSFRSQEVNPERLALFRGLGFNAIEISIPPAETCHSDALAYCASLAQDFQFLHFGIEWQTSSAELYSVLLNPVQLRGRAPGRPPECITFKPEDAESASTSELLQTMYRGLTERGYRVLGNDVYIRPGSALADAQQCGRLSRNLQGYNCQQVMDVVGLGPGNTSTVGGMRMTSAAKLSHYLQDSFDHYRQESIAPGIREVIDQLLCYHQLNLIYFKEQHQLDLEYLFAQLVNPAGSHYFHNDAKLYVLKNHTLALTATGVLRLSSLCQALSQLPSR